MSMNDDPRGFRRGPASRENFQQRGQTQQPRDRFDQYPQQSDQRPPRQPPERPQASFSAYKPEAYASGKGNSQPPAHSANDEWNRNAPQRPARQPRPNMAPPRHEPPASDPYSIPSDMPDDPFYQPAASDPYAMQSPRGFDGNWGNDDFGGAPAQFQDFYPQNEAPGFEGDPQSVHDEFFSGADNGMDDILPPPVPTNGRDLPPMDDAGDLGDFDFGHDSFGAPPQVHPFAGDNDGFGAEPPQRNRAPQAPAPQGFDDQDFYDWEEFEQAPAQKAARPFHPPAVRDEDMDADFFADEDDFDIDEYDETGSGKKKLLAAVLAGAVVVGGGGAYLYNSGGGNIDVGNAPTVIAADNSPIKEQPAEPGGRDFPNGNKLIYDRLGDNGPISEQDTASTSNNSAQLASVPGLVTTSGGTLEERIENALRAQGGEEAANPEPQPRSADTPRTVQTLTFGPDGSQQPTQPQAQNFAANSNGTIAPQPSSSPGYDARLEPSPSETSSVNAAQAEVQPQQSAQQVASINPQAQVASLAPGSGAYFVQIGARNDPQAATTAFKTLQQRYASVIGNYPPSLRKADLGSKGVWYRLWVGPVNSKDQAEALCGQLKAAGMKACLVRKDQ